MRWQLGPERQCDGICNLRSGLFRRVCFLFHVLGGEMNAATETSDGWPGVIAQLDQRHRVVTCRDGIQWIIQRRKGGGAARPWYGVSYCVTRAALIRLCAALNPDVPPAVRALPAYFQRERQP